jgi:hypothetical protein
MRRGYTAPGIGQDSAEAFGVQLPNTLPRRDVFRESSLAPSPPPVGVFRASRQVEYEQQCVFDAAQFVVVEVSDAFAESACIDGADHLAENLGLLTGDGHLGVEAGGEHRTRRRADNNRGKCKQIVRLDDYRETATFLNVATPAPHLDPMDITTDHAASPLGRRRRSLLAGSPRSA